MKKPTPRNITIKFLKSSDNVKILKAVREGEREKKDTLLCRGTKMKMTACLGQIGSKNFGKRKVSHFVSYCLLSTCYVTSAVLSTS